MLLMPILTADHGAESQRPTTSPTMSSLPGASKLRYSEDSVHESHDTSINNFSASLVNQGANGNHCPGPVLQCSDRLSGSKDCGEEDDFYGEKDYDTLLDDENQHGDPHGNENSPPLPLKSKRKTVEDLLLADSDDSDGTDEESDDDKGSFEDVSLLKRLAEEKPHIIDSPVHPTIPPAVFNYISALDAKQELTTLPPQHDPYHDEFAVCPNSFLFEVK